MCVREVSRQSDQGAVNADEFLQATLAERPVATLARLLVWLQQRPELLLLPSKQAAEDLSFADHVGYSHCGWMLAKNWAPYCSC